MGQQCIDLVKKVKIPLPPLSVQEEIVMEIEAYQKIIDGAVGFPFLVQFKSRHFSFL